jgi:hypothetical protein
MVVIVTGLALATATAITNHDAHARHRRDGHRRFLRQRRRSRRLLAQNTKSFSP